MKFLTLLFLFAFSVTGIMGQPISLPLQKPLIDTSTFDTWRSLKKSWLDAKPCISNDGNYVLYNIRESWRTPVTTLIQAINGDWKIELPDVNTAVFTKDGRKAVFIKSTDSLCVLTLGSSTTSYIPRVSNFKLVKQGNVELLIYLLDANRNELRVQNLGTGKEQSFPDVNEYLFSRDGNDLIYKTEVKKDSRILQSLRWVNFMDDKFKIIWEGNNASDLVLDDKGEQLAFKVEDKLDDKIQRSLWYYKKGTGNAVQMVSDQLDGLHKGQRVDGILHYSKDGSKLFIRLKEKATLKRKSEMAKVDVWSYTDATWQSSQLREVNSPLSYTAVLHINGHRVIRLQQVNDVIEDWFDELGDEVILISNKSGEYAEWNWNRTAIPSFYLVNTSTGERKEVPIVNPQMSLDKKYIIGISRGRTDIYSYEIATGKTRNLTGSLPIPVGGVEFDEPYISKSKGLRIVATTANKESIIVYDEFDIWQLDPSRRKAPINLTNGYGRKNNIRFRLAGMYSGKDIPNKGELILLAFNKSNKNSGFYRIVMEEKVKPVLLSMGPYYYEPGYRGACQIMAKDAYVYVVMRETAAESPNYFWTTDFKTFNRLSDVQPEKAYNWMSSELVNFRTTDGRAEQAALYRPENFHAGKKYPVIIHYYDRKTQDLNTYHRPGQENGHIDIAWFVSNGYVVITPDIHFKIGALGESAVSTIVGLADHLSKLSWVEAGSIGLQGHSLGGYQTNYILTQTNRFAAAVSSSGMSDIVSNYLSGVTQFDWYENRICRIGATLWEKPDVYIKNSPVFYAHKLTTPLLTIANKKDANVKFEQGLEWFTALRRLGKKAWMLQYDEGDHGLGGQEYKDYVLRSTQFFDHYLKNAPAPKWMTRGIPAKMKGIDDGLELDHEIKSPGEGLLTPDQKKKVEALKHKKPVTIFFD